MMVLLGGAIGTLRKMNEQCDEVKWTSLLGMNDDEEEEVPMSKWVIQKKQYVKCRGHSL
jgi:hypothetical protein